MQNRQAIVGLVAAAVILLGAGVAYVANKNKPAPQPNAVVTQPTTSKSMVSSSIVDIFGSSENKKCTFDVKSENGETKGTVYVSGGTKAYGNFDMTSSGKTTTSYIIRDNDTFYLWGNAFPAGMKLSMSVDDLAKQMSGSSYQTTGLNPNQKYDYKCVKWNVDQKLFTPPANVKFTDFGSMTLPTGTKTSNSPSSSCGLCSSLTGAAKTSCMSSFHCQ